MAEQLVKAAPANLKDGITEGGITGTRGGLARAEIVEVADVQIDEQSNKIKEGSLKRGTIKVACMFNPFEYTVSKSNSFDEQPSARAGNSPRVHFTKAGAQTLQLQLLFDTYETQEDVTKITNRLWRLMAVQANPTSNDPQARDSPPLVAFIWAGFQFVAYITQMTQKFTLFTELGIPVRATVNVTFTQYVDLEDYPAQNPTSGGGALNRIWQVTGGDRLDTIAAAVYGQANKWRLIADSNQLHDPRQLRIGQALVIPFETHSNAAAR